MESDIFKRVINYEIEKGILGIYVRCEKPKTFFDQNNFKEETGLQVPENILNEIEKNAKVSLDGIWDSELIKGMNYNFDFIKKKDCLTLKDVEKLFKKTGKRQIIILLSQPIFDSKFEHCIISISYSKFTGSAYGRKYFLKKVYGMWTIITEYEFWMT